MAGLCAAAVSIGGVTMVATATPDTSFSGDGWALSNQVSSFVATARGDGGALAVGVANPGQIVVSAYDSAGSAFPSVVNAPGGISLDAPRGMATRPGGGAVAQFSTTTNATALALIDGAGTTTWKTDSVGLCGNGDGDVSDVAVGGDGSIYSVAWNFDGPTLEDPCDGTGIRKYDANGDKQGGAWADRVQDNRVEASSVAATPDGGVVVAGVTFSRAESPTEMVGVLKINADGSPAAFGGSGAGLAKFPSGTSGNSLNQKGGFGNPYGFHQTYGEAGGVDIEVDGSGNIYVLGLGSTGGTIDAWVARLTPNGALDPGFGSGGITRVDAGGHDYALRLAIDGQNRPVVVGLTNPTPLADDVALQGQEFVFRLTTGGALDGGIHLTPGLVVPNHASLAAAGTRVISAGIGGGGGGQGFVSVHTLPLFSGAAATGLFSGSVPTRVLDTREAGGAVVAGSPRTVPVGPPVDAVAVALNITVTEPTEGGYLSVYPSGTAAPTASVLNFSAGQTVANAVVVGVGGGSVDITVGAGAAHVVVDVMGYFGAAQGFTAFTPVRALDTRANALALAPNEARTVNVAPAGGSVEAVALNITAVEATAGGHLRAWPGSGPPPYASVVNFNQQATVANAMVLGVDASGNISVGNFSDGTIHLVVDVMGNFAAGSAFNPVTPVRALDTRDPTNAPALGPGEGRAVKVTGLGDVPTGGVSGVVVNITVTGATSSGYFSVFPTGFPPPTASILNFTPEATVANAVVMGVNPNTGQIDLLNSVGSTHAIVDVLGWF